MHLQYYNETEDSAELVTSARNQLFAVYSVLRELLKLYRDDLAIKIDKPGHFWLETRSPSFNGRRLFFAAAKIRKKYVSYYLPPLYVFPELSTKAVSCSEKSDAGTVLLQFHHVGSGVPPGNSIAYSVQPLCPEKQGAPVM